MKDSIKVALISSSITGLFSLISTTIGLVLTRSPQPSLSYDEIATTVPERRDVEPLAEPFRTFEYLEDQEESEFDDSQEQTQQTISTPERYPINNVTGNEALTIGSITLFVGVATFFIVYMIKKWRVK